MSYAVTLTQADKIDEAKKEGEKALQLSPGDPVMLYYGVCLYSRLKEKDWAVELLKNAVTAGYENFDRMQRDPDFENIRKEPGDMELVHGKQILEIPND